MSIDAVSSTDESFFSSEIDGDHRETEALSSKIQSIWGQIYHTALDGFNKIVHIARSSIGAVVRDAFFFPLKCSLLVNRQEVQKQLQIEEAYCRDFWDPAKPLDPNFKDQGKIREKFAPPEDRTFNIQLNNGKKVEITCRIMQTKAQVGKYYNFVQIPGIFGTITNTVGNAYPYLAAFVNSEKEGVELPPARFILVSENNLNYKPATLDEAGLVLLEILKSLKAEFGDLDQLVAHSLGNILFANALKQIDDPKILPKHVCFDRGPTSVWEASKKYFWGFGRLLYIFAEFGGWASDIEQDIVDFCQKWEARPSILVTGIEQDHHFSGSANLCLGEKIKKIKDIQTLVFDPPRQIADEFELHNMRADFLNPRYLIGESNFIESSENLSEAILRHSLPVDQGQQSLSA